MEDKKVKKVPFKGKQVKLAVAALLAHLNANKMSGKDKDKLFKSEEFLWLQVGLKKVPFAEKKPRRLALANCYNSDREVCLISKDTGKDVKLNLEKQGVTSISKVMSLQKLRNEYKTFALKRQLASSYDTFL